MNEPHEKYFLQNMLVLNIYALNLNKLQKSVYKPSKIDCRGFDVNFHRVLF